ncbi:hypothetical protein N3K66_003509 [Trichothecium roseum]|uniref:Uncharacterized protein n=1 Tax=Trichothecium roseum TaxID=47278 RepID=A0ACC0V6B8_9HYPO|nr:hypothetical protein N3K66_003509 [Trichothecium roseum]
MKSFIPLLAPLAAAMPTKRGTFCGQWDLETAGDYTVYNNLWGMDSADSGEQCTTNNGLASDGSLSWSVDWTWVGGAGSVKSYPNVVVDIDNKPLGDVQSINAEWAWSYTGNNFIANVAFDLFTGKAADGDADYEFMIWLGAFGGAGPISSTGSPIATVDILGTSWNLFNGMNGNMNVFSFVASSNVENFSGDLTAFTKYLISEQGVDSAQILQSVGAGTEPFEGSGVVLATSKYSATVA